jgi:hypothetical protein
VRAAFWNSDRASSKSRSDTGVARRSRVVRLTADERSETGFGDSGRTRSGGDDRHMTSPSQIRVRLHHGAARRLFLLLAAALAVVVVDLFSKEIVHHLFRSD